LIDQSGAMVQNLFDAPGEISAIIFLGSPKPPLPRL
jgi:hypothetical protein